MKVLIYANKSKDLNGAWQNRICSLLEKENIDYAVLSEKYLSDKTMADAVFVFGGDGTILGLTEFCNKNSIPIIGINAGKVGFLTEFEQEETENAIKLLKENKLKKDLRSTLKIEYDGNVFLALNDVVCSRVYDVSTDGHIITVSVELEGVFVDKISGDGVIVSTPTGSTAYSLSAGGAILAPGINACIVTPLSAHSLHQRPIVFSADSDCVISLNTSSAGLFIDGKLISYMKKGDRLKISKAQKKTAFLRKEESNFYKRLEEKLSD